MRSLLKRLERFNIGQLVGLGFALILFLALLIGLGGRVAYIITKRQNEVIQTRATVEALTLQLENLAIQRTQALRRYLETQSALFLVTYRDTEVAYDRVLAELAPLLTTSQELEVWREVIIAESSLDAKAQEVLRLYDSQFPDTARFLWANEGAQVQDELLTAIARLRQVQGETSTHLIDRARYIENRTITIVSLFVVLALIGGMGSSWLISRSITRPLSRLVETTSAIGGDLTVRVEPSGPQEIAFLGQTINEMASSLLSSRRALQAHNERLEQELTLASQVQTSFFPESLPQFPRLELAAFWQSATEVAGDFYTCIQLTNGSYGLVVGDVSGKGAPAAMASALAVGLLEAYAPAYDRPETLLKQLNKDISARFISNYINVACCYAILDTTSCQMAVANAGGVYPYLRRGNTLSEVDVVGMPLGMWPGYEYVACNLLLQADDLLLFSSDGLVEAHNAQGEMFGFDRLEEELRRLPPGTTAQAAVDRLVRVALDFTGEAGLHDDLTIMVLHALS